MKTTTTFNDFVVQSPRVLPVIIAVDRSGSMSVNGKIDALNIAIQEFLNSLKEEDAGRAEIRVAVYSFGGDSASEDLALSLPSQLELEDFTASGRTPMGNAFSLMKDLIDDNERIPSRSYKPTIVLMTDGVPTDDWESSMNSLINDGRSSKAFRIAMAIGADADRGMLGKFVSSPEYLIEGENARDIRKFFQFVTMSVSTRLKSQSPDMPELPPVMDEEDDIFEL
jgi:uncharacterized protein YegL